MESTKQKKEDGKAEDKLTSLLEEHKKLMSQFELAALFSAPTQKITNKTHSLLALTSSSDRINYGPPTNCIVEPPSSGTLN